MPQTRLFPLHPFRTAPLTGPQIGWFRPALAVVVALILPAILALVLIYNGAPTFAGPPKDGSTYSVMDHFAIILGALGFSFLTSWMAAPLALLAVRAAAMLGYAGWLSAVLASWVIGLPMAHVVLNGDVTTDEHAILFHIVIAIACLGLSVWATFWGMIAFKRRTN